MPEQRDWIYFWLLMVTLVLLIWYAAEKGMWR